MLAETICSAVSAAGLGIAAVTAYRKRFLAAARIAAYSLVPVGLVLTGVGRVGRRHRLQPVRLGRLRRARRRLAALHDHPRRRAPRRRHPQGTQGRRQGGTAARRSPRRPRRPRSGRAAVRRPSPTAKPRGRRFRRGLQRHRGDPEEARHLTSVRPMAARSPGSRVNSPQSRAACSVDRSAGRCCAIITPRCSIPHRARPPPPTEEPRGCLFALSQPPLMIFLAVIGCPAAHGRAARSLLL